MVEHIFAALIAILPPIPQPQRRMIAERHDAIVQAAEVARDQYGVPPAVFLVVGFLESHWGTARGSGGSWGSPISRRHRAVAGGPEHTARDLATSYRLCGRDWSRALARYRTGLCTGTPRVGYTPATALRLVERTHAHTGVPLPEGVGPVRLAARR